MLISTSKKRGLLKMLITLIITLVLCTSGLLLIQKPSVVSAATTGSSAVLKNDSLSFVINVDEEEVGIIPNNIVTITITNNSSKIVGFTKSNNNVKDDSSENDIFIYYRKAGYQVSINSGLLSNFQIEVDVLDAYDVVIYADVETIYAPADASYMFSSVDISQVSFENLTSIVFDNFNTSNVTGMGCMFMGCSSLKTLDISSFSFASITSEDNIQMMLGVGYALGAQIYGLDVDTFVSADDAGKIQMLIDADIVSSEEEAQQMLLLFSEPSKIIAPADLNKLSISLPSTYEYTGDSGNKISTDILVAGKTHTLQKASSDVNETGIVSDSIILSLLALCFAISGFMLLKKKRVR